MKGLYSKVSLSLKILTSSSDGPGEAEVPGTRITLPAQDVQCLTRFLCKEMSTAVMLRHIRKTLKCNQSLPGVWGFSGINKLSHPVGFRLGKSSIINVCCPLRQKNEMKCCSGVRRPEHKMPEAASLETKKSQQSPLLNISRPVSFVERAGFLLDPQSSVTKGAVIWTLDNDHSVFNEIQTHMDIFSFLSTALNAFSVWCLQQ